MFKLTPIAVILFITTAINVAVSYTSWQRRKIKGGMYFSLGMMGITLWTLAAALGYAAVPLDLKILFAKIDAVGYNSAISLFILFALYYVGFDEWADKKWLRFILLLIPVSNILLVATNELHKWVWTGFLPVKNNIVIFEHGPGFVWIVITGYLMVLSLTGILWLASRRGSEISRRQGRLLFFASVFPLAANMVYLIGIKGAEGVDWSSITFSITGFLFLRALYGTRLLDLAPIARDKLVNSLSDGMIVLDTQDRIIDINRAAAEMLVSSPAMLLGKDLADIEPLAHTFLGQPLENEIKTELEVGTPNKRYFDVILSPLREGPKKIIGRLIISRDITERKENELRLLQLTQAVEQSPASVIITDINGNIEYVNPQFSILTGYTYNEAIGKKTSIVKSGHTPDEVYRDMWQTILAGRTWRGEFLNKKKNGELYWEQAVMAPVLDHDGHILNFIAVKEDITGRKEAEAQLRTAYSQLEEQMKEIRGLHHILHEQAIHDALTGLHNRHYLNETLGRELARAEREKYPICFALIDIDRFKSVNDKYGHAAGDNVLRHFASQLLKHTRTGDIICRYGGEEFLVVLPNTQIDVAAQIAERWRATIQKSSVLENGVEITATISCGISEFPTDGSTEAEALEKADKALYAAKHNGRNQVALWPKIKSS